MAVIGGRVSSREANGSIGAPLSGAQVMVESVSSGGSFRAETSANGRYSVDVPPGDYFMAVGESAIGSSRVWTRVVNVRDDRPNVSNMFIDSPEKRLETLVHAFPGEMAVYALNLQTNQSVAVNADGLMYLASTSKLLIAAACVDLMRSGQEINDQVTLQLRHLRESLKTIQYSDLGSTTTIRSLLNGMIRSSDTTATDVLCEKFGLDNINDRISSYNFPGITKISSMIQIDKDRWWEGDPRTVFMPDFAFSMYRRQRATGWLNQLGLSAPRIPRGRALWDKYRSTQVDHSSAREFGNFLARVARKTLLNESWKDNLLLNTVFSFGGAGRFSGAADSSSLFVDSKGGSHTGVRNQAGLVRDRATNEPLAVLVAFTQGGELSSGRDSDSFVRAAGDLALHAIGVDSELMSQTPDANSLTITSPQLGDVFKSGERPVIAWKSNNMDGPLTLGLQGENSVSTISNQVRDDGEWHGFKFSPSVSVGNKYQFTMSGTAANGQTANVTGRYFTVGENLQVIRPSAGETFLVGETVNIRWTNPVQNGRVRIELHRDGSLVKLLTNNGRDDGDWRSLKVTEDLDPAKTYQIKISSVDDPSANDTSNFFSIGGSIDVISPTVGQVLDLGTKPSIRWRSRGVSDKVTIALFLGSDRPLFFIANNANNDGEWHSWEVPDMTNNPNYRIEVADKENPGIFGRSETFQIGVDYEWLVPSAEQAAPPPGGIKTARPHFFAYGQAAPLRWRRVGVSAGPLAIHLLKDGAVVKTLTDNARDTGQWNEWVPDDSLAPGSDYSLRLFNPNRTFSFGRSVNFSIGAHIDVNMNMRSVTRNATTPPPVTVNWNSEGISGLVRLELTDRNDNVANTFAASANDDGRFTWRAFSTLPGGRHRLKITSLSSPSVFGFSDWINIR